MAEAKIRHRWLLKSTRIGLLITSRRDGSPIGVPVWFRWDGVAVWCFAGKGSPKLARLARDPRASLLVTNVVGEPEAWIAFDGPVEVEERGGMALAERLAAEYWDLNDPIAARKLEGWRAHPESFALLRLTPQRIRTGN